MGHGPKLTRLRQHDPVHQVVVRELGIDRHSWIILECWSIACHPEPWSVEMTEVLLFHHAQGLTPGVLAFADVLRVAGHTVHTPDLLDGRRFDSVEAGVAYAGQVGFGEVLERGVRAAD